MWRVSVDIKKTGGKWRLIYRHSWGFLFKRVKVTAIHATQADCLEEALRLLAAAAIEESLNG
jgi:hypothetical protein